MTYANIKNCDIANGPGVRVSLFVSGCTHRCPGCFNEVAWDFGYGEPFTEETVETILAMLRPGYIRGLTLLGGEPFEPQNQEPVLGLLAQDPRPSYQNDPDRLYGVAFGDYDFRFHVKDGVLTVCEVEKLK